MTIATMPLFEGGFNRVIAFDVSKAELAVYFAPEGVSLTIPNTKAAIQRLLEKQIRAHAETDAGRILVVCETTGGYERFVLEVADELGLACHRAHGSRVRAFARYRGTHAKSDPIDVRLLADYGLNGKNLKLYQRPPAAQERLRGLLGRRGELKDTMEAEQSRLDHAPNDEIAESIKALIATLQQLLAEIEAKMPSS